uniref:Uncharacterized protein n=1 Tax=Curvibacter symbiont subsp. Hydra magnipapillata TaxID=667019 RepID=C9Y8X6_CURXX|nr:hypothetical protein Csp_A05770 [Curvibacter putative symbiont of Hydra magnipapillata]
MAKLLSHGIELSRPLILVEGNENVVREFINQKQVFEFNPFL